MLTDSQRRLVGLLSDSTRSKILSLLSESPVHPETLVEYIGVSRTAIEKHLKQLLAYGIIERRTQTVPRLRYIYSLTIAAQNLLEAVSIASEQFIKFTSEFWQDQLTKIEQAFVFGIIQKEEFDSIKTELEEKMDNLKDVEEPDL